jgi:hypothetical protein
MPFARPSTAMATPDATSNKLDLQLRLESLDFIVHAHTGYIPRVAIQKTQIEHPIPTTLVSSILISGDSTGHQIASKKNAKKAAALKKDEIDPKALGEDNQQTDAGDNIIKSEDGTIKSAEDDRKNSGYTVSVEKTFLPDYPVNEYGISLRAMRCLEITESVCQLSDLIDLSMREKLGPIDSLRKFATQYREMQKNRAGPTAGSVTADGLVLNHQSGATNIPAAASGLPGAPPVQGPIESSSNLAASPNASNGATGAKRRNKAAPSPSPKLGPANSPAKRLRS